MKLKEYIENLQQIVDKEGDVEIIYSKDDEGNAYHKVNFEPCVFYIKPRDSNYIEEVYNEDEKKDDMIKVICIN